jgi:hypothetical protein|tara:strand:+ start:531 stop:878 length:348 start_codon:yes stop_codon:yes gene_type:complete
MSYYARINSLTKKVDKVISAEEEYINSLPNYDLWVKTSYNTIAGTHTNGGVPLRKNYASVGYIYDVTNDAFHKPKPFDSWTLNQTTYTWIPPTEYPTDGKMYTWNEDTTNWVETT